MPGSLADWMRNKLKPTPTDIQSAEIGGAEAAIGARPRGSDTGLGQVRYVMVRHGDQRLLLQPPERRARSRPADRRPGRRGAHLPHAVRRRGGGAASLSPARDRADGASAAQLAQRLPYGDYKMERLLALNGVDSAAELVRLPQVKTIERLHGARHHNGNTVIPS